VAYRCKLADGSTFALVPEHEPFEFIIGQKITLPGFENAIIGMSAGESKKVSLSAEDAFGPYREDLVIDTPRSSLPSHIDLQVGM